MKKITLEFWSEKDFDKRKPTPQILTPYKTKTYLPLDIETIGLNPKDGTIWSITVGSGKKVTIYKDCNGLVKMPKAFYKQLIDPTVCKIIHNAAFDAPYIALNLEGDSKWKKFLQSGIPIVNIWDSSLAENVLIGRHAGRKEKEEIKIQFSNSLKYCLARRKWAKLNKAVIHESFVNRPKGIPFNKKEENYMKEDVMDLIRLKEDQTKKLVSNHLLDVAELENRTVEKVVQMKYLGIGFDKKIWENIARQNEIEYQKRLKALPKSVKNWNSPAQVKEYFNSIGVPLGSYDDIEKVYLQTRHKTLAKFIWARQLYKATTSYGMSWFEAGYIDSDGRIRGFFQQIINTGRFSMSEPNLQQLPGEYAAKTVIHQYMMDLIRKQLKIKDKIVHKHRSAFVPGKGKAFVIGDFSGQEMGIMAAASGEKVWIDALLAGHDIHAVTASLIHKMTWFNAAEKGCSFPFKCNCKGHKELRMPTKILNFMLAYGGGPQRLAEDTGMQLYEAIHLVKLYKSVVPRVTKWLDDNGKAALNTGYAYSADPFRRRRTLSGEEGWQIVNQGKNSPVQSAGANMLKLAMCFIPNDFPIVLVIHDEIILEVPTAKAKQTAKVLKKAMEDAADFITGIKSLVTVEPRIAKNLLKDTGVAYRNKKFVQLKQAA